MTNSIVWVKGWIVQLTFCCIGGGPPWLGGLRYGCWGAIEGGTPCIPPAMKIDEFLMIANLLHFVTRILQQFSTILQFRWINWPCMLVAITGGGAGLCSIGGAIGSIPPLIPLPPVPCKELIPSLHSSLFYPSGRLFTDLSRSTRRYLLVQTLALVYPPLPVIQWCCQGRFPHDSCYPIPSWFAVTEQNTKKSLIIGDFLNWHC